MAGHAKLSASGAHRWLACPGSVRLEDGIADAGSAYAAEGTLAHELAEICLARGWDAHDLPPYAEASRGEDWGRYPDDMRQHVQSYLDLVRGFPGALLVETRVTYDRWVPEGFGTADALVIDDTKAALVDLKYGQGVKVYADGPQLKLYALGAIQTHGWLYDIQTWELVICQPRIDHIDAVTVSTGHLLEWAETVVAPAAALALTDGAPLSPGEHQCRFCRAKAVCRSRRDANLKVAYADFGPLPKPDSLDLGEIAALLGKLDEMEQWAKDVRDYAMSQAESGHDLPGYKLVEGRSYRQWTDEAAVIRRLRALKYLKSDYIVEKLIGIGEAEKLLGGKKAATPILDELTVKPPGRPALVPEADKRPALNSAASARADFNQAA